MVVNVKTTPTLETTRVAPSQAAAVACDAPSQLFIGGQWVAAKGGRTFDVIDPSTADAIATVCDADIPDAMAAVDAAEKAAAGWKATPPRRRSDVLMKCFHLLLEQAEWLAQLISLENGKALADARPKCLRSRIFPLVCRRGGAHRGRTRRWRRSGANRIIVQYPTDWHRRADHALEFPGSDGDAKNRARVRRRLHLHPEACRGDAAYGARSAQIMLEAGVPAGVVNCDHDQHAGPVVKAMLHDRRIRKLSFTGSTERWAGLLLREAADRSSTVRWNWAAMRPSWFSTMPTSTPPSTAP